VVRWAASLAGIGLLLGGRGHEPAQSAARSVVVVGIAGLGWEDLDPELTPHLAELATEGSVGALSVRSAPSVTCRSEGWATLGAATYAAVTDPGEIDPAEGCAARPVPPVSDLPALDELNRGLRFGARLGWLSDHVECIEPLGPGAKLAAGGGGGDCPVTLVDLGELAEDGRARRAGLRRFDEALGVIVGGLGDDDVVMVLGVAETDARQPHLHPAIVAGPGFRGGYLRSASTRRPPYVQLVDVAPSIVQALGDEAPDTAAGRPFVGGAAGRPATLRATTHTLADLEHRAVQQRRVLPEVWTALGLAYAVVIAALVAKPARRLRVAGLAMTGVPAATFLANLVPWWRAGRPGLVLLGAVVGATALIVTVAVVAGRGDRRREVLAVAVASLGVLGVDVVAGGGLQVDSLLGYNALHAGRFVGFGNIAFAVLGAAAVLAATLLAHGRRPGAAAAIVAAVALPTLALDGAPRFGADFGGVLTLVPTFAVLALLVTGATVTWRRFATAQLAGAVVVGAIGWLDHLRPPADRSHFGRFVGTVLDGTAFETIRRKALASWELLFIGPHTLAALALTIGLVAVALKPPPRLDKLRPLLQTTLVLALVGFATNDSGVAIPTVIALVMVPAVLVLIEPRPGTGAPNSGGVRAPQPRGWGPWSAGPSGSGYWPRLAGSTLA